MDKGQKIQKNVKGENNKVILPNIFAVQILWKEVQ